YIFRDQLRIELWCLDFLNVDLDLLPLRHLGNLFCHFLDLGALASNHDARTRSENGYPDAVPCSLDHNFRNSSVLQLLLSIIPNLQVGVQNFRQLLWPVIPPLAPA